MTRAFRAVFGACLLAVVLVVPVAAHAELEESDPADGAIITTPYTLTATFSEDFDSDPEQSFIRIQNSAGDVVAEGGHDDQEATMTVALPALPAGEYTARWQTTTVDDSGVERGTFTFSVEASATAAPTPTPVASEPVGGVSMPPGPVTPAPTQVLTPTPSGEPGNGSTGGGTEVLLALAAGIAIVGVLAYFLVRRSRT